MLHRHVSTAVWGFYSHTTAGVRKDIRKQGLRAEWPFPSSTGWLVLTDSEFHLLTATTKVTCMAKTWYKINIYICIGNNLFSYHQMLLNM